MDAIRPEWFSPRNLEKRTVKRRVNRISNWYGGIPVENVFFTR
jgi:hypothetical protein